MSAPLQKLSFRTYLAMLENSPGTRLFNSLYVRSADGGEVRDVFNNGEFSCAGFVTSVLTLSGLLESPSATVDTAERRLRELGWEEVAPNAAEKGDIVFWAPAQYPDGSGHRHMGFALSASEAVSTDSIEKQVMRHPISRSEEREGKRLLLIERVLRAPAALRAE